MLIRYIISVFFADTNKFVVLIYFSYKIDEKLGKPLVLPATNFFPIYDLKKLKDELKNAQFKLIMNRYQKFIWRGCSTELLSN